MKHQLYTIHDSKAQIYLPPFTMLNVQTAIRIFTDTINSPTSTMGRHPEDYILFHIGTYDDNTAMIERNIVNESIITGIDVKTDLGLDTEIPLLKEQQA